MKADPAAIALGAQDTGSGVPGSSAGGGMFSTVTRTSCWLLRLATHYRTDLENAKRGIIQPSVPSL